MDSEYLYTVDWDNPSGFDEIGEFKVPLPVMPALETMANYGLPIEQQKFKRTEIPVHLKRKRPIAEGSEDELFIQGEYHKRHNGIWQLIKGQPIYFTGAYYFFLNYWTTQGGKQPDFLIAQQKMFLFDEFCVRDPHCYGGYFIKARRIGGTEMTLADQYDFATKYRNVFCGMQSKNEKSVIKNYNRLIKAHKKMIWFMLAEHTGSTANKDGLYFNYPPEQKTAKRNKEEAEKGTSAESIYSDDELGSSITYGPSVATEYDGEELNKWTLNEFGKLEKMSLLECWDKVKPTLHRNNGKYIVGKAKFESTIEQINDNQLQEINEMWEESDPNNRNDNGRTLTGLYRVFFNALDCADPDEWGFPKREEDLKFLENEFKALEKAGNSKKIADLKRKTPLVIEDALTPSGDQSAFNKGNLQEAIAAIDFPDKTQLKKPAVRGNLMWENGTYDGIVIFEPNPEGFFEFSMLPGPDTFKGNAVDFYGIERIPGNVNKIRIGVDPYDHKEVVDNRKSKGGAVGGIMYDDLKDGAKINEDGKPFDLAAEWETYQPIFTYYHRRDDPQDFFEDMLMAAVFCGAPILFENNKQSIRNHFYNRGYKNFIMQRPEGTLSAAQRQQSVTDGIPASENTIQQYYDAIDTFISRNAKSIKHRNLIVDLLAMNRSNHGKHDLGVAFGWLLIAMTKKYANIKPKEEEPEQWFEVYTV